MIHLIFAWNQTVFWALTSFKTVIDETKFFDIISCCLHLCVCICTCACVCVCVCLFDNHFAFSEKLFSYTCNCFLLLVFNKVYCFVTLYSVLSEYPETCNTLANHLTFYYTFFISLCHTYYLFYFQKVKLYQI